MFRNRTATRTIAAAGFLAAAGLFLTACNSGDDAAGGSDKGDSKAASDSRSLDGKTASGKKRVLSGKVTYMAPGKLMVGNRAFFVAEDTKIQGADICSDPETTGVEDCTAEQLETAAKDGGVDAQVTMKKGVALEVIGGPESGGGNSGGSTGENGGAGNSGGPAGTNGGAGNSGGSTGGNSGGGSTADGTFSGTLTYLAPGKLMVGNRAFFVAEDTEMVGGQICGDAENTDADNCTVEDLEATAKKGNLKVSVTVKKGVAERVAAQ